MTRLSAALAGIALALAGCDSGSKLHRVTGTVSWKGTPIEKGQINFFDANGATTPASAKIEGGKFEVWTTAGVKKVEVFNQRSLGFNKAMNQHTYTNDIPAEYNAESRLRFEVKPGDDNVFDAALPQK